MPGKRQFHHGNLRQALADAAMQILDETGPDAITIREVARRTGVSHAAPINHFKDRRALLTEVALKLFIQLSREIESSVALVGSTSRDRVRAFASSLIEFGLAQPQRYRMLWRRDLVDNADPRLNDAMDEIYAGLIDEISRIINPAIADPHTSAIGIWSLAHGYVSLRLDGNFEAAADETTGAKRQDAILDAYLASILAHR